MPNPLLDFKGRAIAFDTETTRLPPKDKKFQEYPDDVKIISFGAVELMDGVPTGRVWETFFNPGCKSDPGAVAVHGMTDDFLKGFPPLGEDFIARLYYDILRIDGGEPVRLYAHNSQFDIDMLMSELHRLGYITEELAPLLDAIDTRTIFRAAYPYLKRYRLEDIQKHLGVTTSRDKHGALLDTKIMVECMMVARQSATAQAIARLEKDTVLGLAPDLPDYAGRTPRPIVLKPDQIEAGISFMAGLAKKFPGLAKPSVKS